MKILGVETSCDETAAAVVKDKRQILSNVVMSQIKEHTIYGGVVPEIASRKHIENISSVVKIALLDAKLCLDDIDAIAVTYSPGLIGALLVGVNFAKSLAYAESKALIAVHHLKGHVASLYLSNKTLEPPFIALIASGAHTHIVEVNDYSDFNVLGRSVDDAAGEAFDKVARALGLGYPGGPLISELAKSGDPNRYVLPNPHTDNPFDISFSGLKTAVMNILNIADMTNEAVKKEDIAASFEHRAVEMLTSRLFEAAKNKKLPVAICGGVAVNTALRERMKTLSKEKGIESFFADKTLCGDNAAMIAAAAFYEKELDSLSSKTLNANASLDM